ncbi:MAG: hypothetical protein KDI79_07445 [Anaerolineae bacterium]|nr:hypothetical protein [Anaerolineae bacterium]
MHWKPRSQSLASLLIVTAVLSLFLPALLNPFLILHPTFSPFSDTMVIHWPKAHLMAQSWQQGHGLPHWTPYILSGMPLAANQLAMLSYPPAWLFLFLPLEPTFNLLFIFHLLLGGFGIYFLLREYKLSTSAALLGSLTFALNGKWLAHAAGGHVSMVGAVGWMPWTLLGVVMLMHRDLSVRPAIPWLPGLIIAVSLGMQIVTHTLPVIYTVYLIAAIVGWHLILSLKQAREQAQPWGDWLRPTFWRLLYLATAVVVAGLLGAGQLLPLLELVDFSNRSLSPAQAAEYAVTPVQLAIGLLLPSAQGGHELVIYLGLIPLLIVPFGISRQQPWGWFYAALLVFTILFALGPATPVHSLFYDWALGFRWVRTPARIFFVGAIATSVLVGFGIDRLLNDRWTVKAQQWLTRLALATGATAIILGLGLAVGFGQAGRATIGLALLVPLGLVVILLRVRQQISGRLSVLLLGLLLYIDLASFGLSMMTFTPLDEVLAQGRLAAEFLAQQPGLFRVYSPSYSLPTQTAAASNLQLADGVEPVHLSIYDEFMAQAGGYHDSEFSVTIPHFGDQPLDIALKDVEPNLKLLGLLNVTYLASAFPMDWPGLRLVTEIDGTYIYHNDYAMPRAWVSPQTRRAEADWLAQLEALPDLAAVAVVKTNAPQANNLGSVSQVDVVTYAADVIELETTTDAAGWLVVSEIWYPGWQATVNGSIQPVERVDGLLRGVYLAQPGPYRVTLRYQPRSVVWGNWLTGITAVVLGLGIIWRLRSRTKISAPAGSF